MGTNNEEQIKETMVDDVELNHEEQEITDGNAGEKSINEVLSKKEDEIAELNNKLIRLQADFMNYRKRAEKEKENSISYGIEAIVLELLPIVDNFQRALESELDKENSFYQGVKMIEQQLINLLNKNNVVEIESVGREFNPNYHHAVFMEESEEFHSGVVIEILQKGYSLKDKVIRPAMVKVAK